MKAELKHSMRMNSRGWILILAVGTILIETGLRAFPPAPHHLFYGIIRDDFGQPVTSNSAEVIVETDGGVAVRTPISPGVLPGVNYRITVAMDSGFTPDPHKPTALFANLPFTVKVFYGKRLHVPIEMAGNLMNLGQAGGETRLDLTLGEDTDGDGLPDAWEREMIRLAHDSKINSLEDIKSDEDLDGDGMSNRQEYLAGVVAFDKDNNFQLRLVDFVDGRAHMEFLSASGRTYHLYGSRNLKQWEPIGFQLNGEDSTDPVRTNHYVSAVQLVRLEVPAEVVAGGIKYFRIGLE